MSVHDIVSRLDHCRQVSGDSWIARCPSHEDRSPSLSIKDAGGGRTLIHCHAGCGANDVLLALGFELGDLYPPTDKDYRGILRKPRGEAVDSLVVELAEHDRALGKRLSKADVERYREALKRNPPKTDTITEIFYEAGGLSNG